MSKKLVIGWACVALLLAGWSYDANALDVVIPDDYFDFTITGSPELAEDGYIYATLAVRQPRGGLSKCYMTIFDNEGNIVWFQRSPLNSSSWMHLVPLESANRIAVGIGGTQTAISFALFDLTYTIVDTLIIPQDDPENNPYNYRIDTHELFMDDDGNYWVECRYDSVMDMTQYVGEGACEDAVVTGHAIVQLDADQNIIYDWRSLDHLEDLPFSELDSADVYSDGFEHTHANGVEVDDNGDLYLTMRSFSKVIKIDRETGDVVWKMGLCESNQFTFVDDLEDEAFSMPHDFRILPNGNFTIFNNGNNYETPTSYAKEYALDEENMTATLVWSYVTDPPVYGYHVGSTRRLANGNTLVGWGHAAEIGATEVTSDGQVAWQIEIESDPDFGTSQWSKPYSYRYLKSTMIGTAAIPYVVDVVNEDTVSLACNWFGHEEEVFGYNVYMGQSAEPTDLHGSTDTGVYEINGLTFETTYYIRIKALDTNGNEIGGWSNEVEVTPVSDVSDNPVANIPQAFELESAWPNPFNPSTAIALTLPQRADLTVTVYNVMGREVAQLANSRFDAGRHTFQFNGSSLASGVYFVKATMNGGQTQTMKVTLMK